MRREIGIHIHTHTHPCVLIPEKIWKLVCGIAMALYAEPLRKGEVGWGAWMSTLKYHIAIPQIKPDLMTMERFGRTKWQDSPKYI